MEPKLNTSLFSPKCSNGLFQTSHKDETSSLFQVLDIFMEIYSISITEERKMLSPYEGHPKQAETALILQLLLEVVKQ